METSKTEGILSLYILGLYTESRLPLTEEPTKTRILCEIKKDLDKLFAGYTKELKNLPLVIES